MLWDFIMQRNHVIEPRRPDSVVVVKEERVFKMIDMAIPNDYRNEEKRRSEVWDSNHMRSGKGDTGCGSFPSNLKRYQWLEKINGRRMKSDHVQKTSMLLTVRILRVVLETWKVMAWDLCDPWPLVATRFQRKYPVEYQNSVSMYVVVTIHYLQIYIWNKIKCESNAQTLSLPELQTCSWHR